MIHNSRSDVKEMTERWIRLLSMNNQHDSFYKVLFINKLIHQRIRHTFVHIFLLSKQPTHMLTVSIPFNQFAIIRRTGLVQPQEINYTEISLQQSRQELGFLVERNVDLLILIRINYEDA